MQPVEPRPSAHVTVPVDSDTLTPAGKQAQRAQVLRYLVVGVGNTLFGYACYAAFVALYRHLLPAHERYMLVDLASISATLVGVTFSFVTNKFLVFRTEGNYFREWFRCLLVYGAATIPGLFILPPLTRLLMQWPRFHDVSPYLAGAVVMGGTAVCTYLAHKKFSFAVKAQPDAIPSQVSA